MRRIATPLEVMVSVAFLGGGGYLLFVEGSGNSKSAGAIVILGAVFFTMGLMILTTCIRSILWHRRMLRHAVPQPKPRSGAPA